MSHASDGLSDILQRVLVEYPVEQVGEGISSHPTQTDIEQRLPKRIRETIDIETLQVKGSVGAGVWTAIPWVAAMDGRETDNIQEGIYVVYLFEPQENRVALTLNQGVTLLKNERGTAAARQRLRKVAKDVESAIDPEGFSSGPLDFPHASNRNELYGPGTIFYKYYTLGSIPDDDELEADLQTLIDSYQDYIMTHHLDPEVYQCPIKPGGTIERNYKRTVLDGVSRSAIDDICDVPVERNDIRVWGNRSETPANPGDYLLFAQRDGRYDGKYTLLARIADATILDNDAAREFTDVVGWGKGIDDPFPHVLFFDSILEVDLDQESFWDLMGFNGWPNDTYSRIDFDRNDSIFYNKYDSVGEFLNEIKGYEIYPSKSPSPDPRTALNNLLEEESVQAPLYRQAAAHLIAGKNVVF